MEFFNFSYPFLYIIIITEVTIIVKNFIEIFLGFVFLSFTLLLYHSFCFLQIFSDLIFDVRGRFSFPLH